MVTFGGAMSLGDNVCQSNSDNMTIYNEEAQHWLNFPIYSICGGSMHPGKYNPPPFLVAFPLFKSFQSSSNVITIAAAVAVDWVAP